MSETTAATSTLIEALLIDPDNRTIQEVLLQAYEDDGGDVHLCEGELRRYLGCDDTDFHTCLGNDIWLVTEYEPLDVGEVLNCWQWGDEFHPAPDKALLCRCDVSEAISPGQATPAREGLARRLPQP
jgi:hypothetical protein